MKKCLLVAFALIHCCAFAQEKFNYKTDYSAVVARTKDKKDKLFYDTQIKRFTSNDATLTDFEVLALMVGFSGRPEFNPTKDLFKESIVYELNASEKYAEASGMASKELKINPLSLKGIYGKSYALLKLQQKDSANFYAKQWQKILKAMFLSGKGMSAADPIFSLGPVDGKEFVNMFIGGTVASNKTEKDKDGRVLEVYDVALENKKLTLYFIIDHAARRLEEEAQSK